MWKPVSRMIKQTSPVPCISNKPTGSSSSRSAHSHAQYFLLNSRLPPSLSPSSFLPSFENKDQKLLSPFVSAVLSSFVAKSEAEMRMSCNGCRVLRKGCSENCSIRPCLQWIKSAESQANATVFLAKFYGRAGLMNLINAGPEHLRPAIFRSLLYEACGRIVNPIYGSVGLMWSGSWPLCQAAVEAVLKGVPITPINSEIAANAQGPPLKAYDIRHVSKDENSAASNDANRVRSRCRVGRVVKPKASKPACGDNGLESIVVDMSATRDGLTRSTSHDSSVSHQSGLAMVDGESKETDESVVSVETAEESLLFRAEPESKSDLATHDASSSEIAGLGLNLTLGLEPVSRAHHVVPVKKRRIEACGSSDIDTCKMELGLDYSA